MQNLKSFLSKHPDILKKTVDSSKAEETDSICLDVIFIKTDGKVAVFSHFNTNFNTDVENIIGIEAADRSNTNIYCEGIAVRMKIKSEAQIFNVKNYLAKDLVRGFPYALCNPSEGNVYEVSKFTSKETEWLNRHNIQVQDNFLNNSSRCGTRTDTYSSSICPQFVDDNVVDDGHFDDSQVDD